MALFHACDIRGVALSELTIEMAQKIARAIGVKLKNKKVVVGGDIRTTTVTFKDIIIAGLKASGCEVIDIGIVATPVFYYAIKTQMAEGGVMITASHNPAQYNGFKLVLGENPVKEADIKEIERLVQVDAKVDGNGVVTTIDIIDDYINYISAKAKKGQLKVVLDAGNGAVSKIAPNLFRACGYDVVELFCEPDGNFPNRSPNPSIPTNLGALCQKVLETNADLGVAFDGDGDRAAFVDENGRAVDNDDILVLLSRYYLQQGSGNIIYDAKCSMVVPEEIAKAGGRAIMARAGHTFSKMAFIKEKAFFAGEISGHFFFSELGNDDGMFGGIKVAEYVMQKGKLSQLIDEIPNYLVTPEYRIHYKHNDKEEVLAEIAEKLKEYNPNLIDGVRIEFADGWGMIRASVTEPLFTLRFEAKSQQKLAQIRELLLKAIPTEVASAVRAQIALEL